MDPTDLIGQLLAALDSAPPSDTLGVLTGFLADAIGNPPQRAPLRRTDRGPGGAGRPDAARAVRRRAVRDGPDPRSRSCHRQARRGECRLAAGVPGERPGRRLRAVRPGATVPRISGTTPRSCASTGGATTRLCPQPALTLPGLPHRLQEFLAP